jgi:DNA polymerase delta subunit 1
MAASVLPQKRVFGEASSTRRNIPATPSSNTKKRRLEPLTSSPATSRIPGSSQNGPKSKLASSQPKSAFEIEVLEKMSQDMAEMKEKSAEQDQSWERPPVAADFNPKTHKLTFQSIEAEEGYLHGGQATVKLFGVTEHGNSVLLHVKDFKHYLYVAAPVSFAPGDCGKFEAFLENGLGTHTMKVIHSVTMVMRENIYGFQGNTQSPYLKITVTDPKHIPKVRSAFEGKGGQANWKGLWKTDDGIMTYDNIAFVLRFMVDCSVR